MSNRALHSGGNYRAEATKDASQYPPQPDRRGRGSGLGGGALRPDTDELLNDEDNLQEFWKPQTSIKLVREGISDLRQAWSDMAGTLKTLADGADLVLTGMIHQASP
ncbi:hypothetical protein I551_8728 [Mycobacterium ulcerans str. Harvey]|uniref:Uncharacterized protein n=1 Tax=Mycobacterium ulcerans str. Harvey TaxID=1299332 RepID=A0ABN0RA52_MYCUL|nr:hypothetical protein I551_8728 [Mycobacterium ulcerans str. Harvey]